MPSESDQWGVRLADVRLPSWYWLGAIAIVLARLIGTLRIRKAWDEASTSLTEAGEHLAQRMFEGDMRDERVAELTEQMAVMTRRMEAYGRTSVKLATASLVIAGAALAVAVIVSISG